MKNLLTVLNRLLYNKKIQAIPPLPVDDKFISEFYEKANLFITFLHQYVRIKTKVYSQLFHIKQTPQ